MSSRVVRWATATGLLKYTFGITVLPNHGVVIVSSHNDGIIHAHRLSNGVRIASVKVPSCSSLTSDDESDPLVDTIYTSSGVGGRYSVAAYRWDGASMISD